MVAAKALIMAGYDVMTSGPGDADALAKHFQVPFTRSRLSTGKLVADPEMQKAFAVNDMQGMMTAQDRIRDELVTPETRARETCHFDEHFLPHQPCAVLTKHTSLESLEIPHEEGLLFSCAFAGSAL
uniref:Uncharacterized protein n=1 Tax=Durusdinium trenchii TaxID=1381693 RepID=A0ABP0HFW4_9DINO